MTKGKHQVESILMKERWELTQSGVPQNQIKVRNSGIYVYNKMHGRVIDTVFVHRQTTVNDRLAIYREAPTHCLPKSLSRHTISSITSCFYSIVEYKGSSSDSCSPLEPNNGSHSLPLSASTMATHMSSVPDKSKAPRDTSGATDWLPNEVNFGLLNSRSIASKL